jgi:hypothetical protein
LARQGAASLGEMMSEPPAFSYGSSINVWIVKDEARKIREIAVTGHGDSPTCRRVSGQVMSMFLEKHKEPGDLFVAGAAHMVDRGSTERRQQLEELPVVKDYRKAFKDYTNAKVLVMLRSRVAGAGSEDKTALEIARAEAARAEQRVEELKKDPSVAEYLIESKSADAMYVFAGDVREFAADNGLVIVREVPLGPIEKARARVTAAAAAGAPAVVSFEDLLATAKTKEAALFMPVLTVPEAKPLELRIPLATLAVSSFEDARRSNRDEVEQAIVGNARQRLAVFNKTRKGDLEQQARCRNTSPAERRKIVKLTEGLTPDGVPYKLEHPEEMPYGDYCEVRVPNLIRQVTEWIEGVNDLLKKVEEDAELRSGSRLEDFTYSTLVDSMLRDWRLPVARSQAAFDTWRGAARGNAWDALLEQVTRAGVAEDVIGGEQMIFSVQLAGPELIIRPLHVIDMARSVVIIDRAARATRVLDAWSLRSATAADTYNAARPAPDLVRSATRRLAEGEPEIARAELVEAFSLDPGAAFREVENEWLSLFPDTRQRMLEMERSLQPVVEAAAWREAYRNMQSSPESKEGARDFVAAFRNLLESYPKAPVDLHLELALYLAKGIADFDNSMRLKRGGAALATQTRPWDVIEAFGQPSNPTSIGIAPRSVPALREWRRKMQENLQQAGFKGTRLSQALNILEGIETSSPGSAANQERLLPARREVSLRIFTDPAPIIAKAVETVRQRAPEYYAAASLAGKLPEERSREWLEADKTLQRELTLFELGAQSLSRLEDGLRKSYFGSRAAKYLWATPTPDLRQLLPLIDTAVGDGHTGFSPAYVGVRSRVKLFLDQRRAMDTLARVESAAALQNGSESLLAVERTRIERQGFPEPFRDALPLRSRVWFEAGEYQKAFEGLLTGAVPVALYHPGMRWEALPGDAARNPTSVKARLEGGRIIFAATFDGTAPADVLAVSGLTSEDAKRLLNDFAAMEEQSWSDYGKVSDQILLSPVPVRPAAEALRELLLAQDVRLRIMKSMVYGHTLPGDELIRGSGMGVALGPSIPTPDQVKGDQGRRQRVPTLAEVKRIAAAKIARND